MDYEEIIAEFKKGNTDISDLKQRLADSSSLKARNKELDFSLVMNNLYTVREGINIRVINEIPEKVEFYKSSITDLLTDYFVDLIDKINNSKAWKLMNIAPTDMAPTKITISYFTKLSIDEKLKLVILLNRRFKEYLELQKYADLRSYMVGNRNVNDDSIREMQFIITMFYNLKSSDVKHEFCYLPKDLLTALVSFKKSYVVRMEDFFERKPKKVKQEYEKYSEFFSTEDFRDIIENLVATSKTLKISVSSVIEYYTFISGLDYEISGLEDEYDIFESLQEKNAKMRLIESPEQSENTENDNSVENVQAEEKQEKEENNNKENDEVSEKEKAVEQSSKEKNETVNETKKTKKSNKPEIKEYINPLILAWFGKESKKTLTELVGENQLSDFFEKIKQIEEQSKVRVGVYIVTNANKEITLSRMQELQSKAEEAGLPNLIEGALGGYSTFRIDKDENVTNLSFMEKNTREKVISLLEKSDSENEFTRELVDDQEKNYVRYFFSTKKSQSVNFKYLKSKIDILLKNPSVKKQPLSFVPFIEDNYSGVDVLLQSQLEGINQLSTFLKSKYSIAPGKTLKANIYTLNKFAE